MPLPRKADARRMVAEWRTFELDDPSFERPVKIALRPLLAIEVDKADESRRDFVARHVAGGFYNEVSEEWQETPIPLMVEGSPVELTDALCIRFFRVLAMQEPMAGMPSRPEGCDKITVQEMAEATVCFDEFWRGLDDAYMRVWMDGYQGKGWNRPRTSEPPPEGS